MLAWPRFADQIMNASVMVQRRAGFLMERRSWVAKMKLHGRTRSLRTAMADRRDIRSECSEDPRGSSKSHQMVAPTPGAWPILGSIYLTVGNVM